MSRTWTTRRGRLPPSAVVPALLLLLVACPSSASAGGSARRRAAGSPGGSGRGAVSMVACSGSSCSVTLGGDSRVHVLGTTISFEGVRDRRATLRVGDQAVTCTEGQSVSAGRFRLSCTSVTADTVTFTATAR